MGYILPPRDRTRRFSIKPNFELLSHLNLLRQTRFYGETIDDVATDVILVWSRRKEAELKFELSQDDAQELGYYPIKSGRRVRGNKFVTLESQLGMRLAGMPRYYIERIPAFEQSRDGKRNNLYQRSFEEVILNILDEQAPKRVNEAIMAGWIDED